MQRIPHRAAAWIGLSLLGAWLADPDGPATGEPPLAFSPVYSAKVLKAMQKVRGPRKGRIRPRKGWIPANRTSDGKPGRAMTASKAGRKAFLMKRIGDPQIKASQQHFRDSEIVERESRARGHRDEVSEMQQVAKELLGMITDHRDFSIAIGVLSQRRQHDLMFKMIDDMDKRLGPNVVTYSVAIKGRACSLSFRISD